jgi:hypothetical protein
MTMVRLVALLLGFLVSLPAQGQTTVEGWRVAPFDAGDGCMMSGTYERGTTLGVVLFKSRTWGIYVANPNYTLRKGARFDVKISVDSRSSNWLPATALSTTSYLVPLAGSEIFEALQGGFGVEVRTTRSSTGRLSLRGTRRAMDSVLACVAGLPPPAPANTPPNPGVAKRDFRMLPAREAVVVVANLLSASGITGHRLAPIENDKSTVKFFLADGTVGTFEMASGRDAPEASAYARYVENTLANSCSGRKTIDQQSVPTLDGSVIRKIFFGCTADDQRTMVESTVIRRIDGILIDLSFYNVIKADDVPNLQINDRVLLTKAAIAAARRE